MIKNILSKERSSRFYRKESVRGAFGQIRFTMRAIQLDRALIGKVSPKIVGMCLWEVAGVLSEAGIFFQSNACSVRSASIPDKRSSSRLSGKGEIVRGRVTCTAIRVILLR